MNRPAWIQAFPVALALLAACSVDEKAATGPRPHETEIAAASATSEPDPQGFSPERLARATAVMRERVAAGRMPGGVLLIARDGEVVLEEAIGVLDPKTSAPMSKDAIFRIHSMTKPITSVAVMMLVEEGKVQLADPASKYFPELKSLQVGVEKPQPKGSAVLELVPQQREMTVQDLLRHTSGLTYGIFGKSLVKDEYLKAKVDARDVTSDELISRIAKVPLHFQPGTTWEYSRSTDVLGVLVERVSGQTLDAFVQQRILGPLKMKDSGFWVQDSTQHARIAQPFAVDPDTKLPVELVDVRNTPSFFSGGGGMVSTARDYLRFAQAMLNGGTLEGARILSPHTVQLMASDHTGGVRGPSYTPGPGYGFGLGFAVRVAEGEAVMPGSVGDYSWGGYAGTLFWIDPHERLVAIWMMQAPGARNETRALFRTLVYSALVSPTEVKAH
jgi:CubicO group peptidase (beta-lactamase class C family)